jgi:surface polysaccharide O-acyltransferase-like enzyme
MRSQRGYIFSADLVRAVAAVGVVVLHVSDAVYLRPDFFGGKVWWLTHFMGMLSRSAVPLFIMLSGYLTLNRGKTLEEQWHKSLKRIVIPAVSAFVIYLVFDLLTNRLPWPGALGLGRLIWDRLNDNSGSFLFFLIVLWFLYLATPFLDYVFTQSRKLQAAVIGGTLLITILSLLAHQTTFKPDTHTYNTYTMWIFYIGYYLYGYFVRDLVWSKRRELLAFLGLMVVYLVGVLGSFWVYSHREFSDVVRIPYFSNYFSVTIMAQSLLLFTLAMKSGISEFLDKQKLVSTLIRLVASASFGIYLYHLLVMYALCHGVDYFFSSNLIVYLAFSLIIVFMWTFLLVTWLRRTGLRWLVGE